jgi:penicillin-binding protein 1A
VPQPRLRRRRRHRYEGRRVAVVALLLVGALAVATATVAVIVVATDPAAIVGCRLDAEHTRRVPRTSFMTARDGSRLGALPAPRIGEPVPISRMSRWLPLATVAIEDRRFWQHGALDYQGIARAAWIDAQRGRIVQGGSTLTQQLVRTRYLGPAPMTLRRKLNEACLATELAQRWSKRRILEAYLNSVFYGHGAFGVEAAAQTLFSRPARRVTLRRAALLAGLPQAPTLYDPLRHRRVALARRNEVLAAMHHAGQISTAAYRAAVSHGLGLHPGARYRLHGPATFTDFALHQTYRRFGLRARFAGLHVQTTLNPRMQRLADQAISRWLHLPSDPAAALVAMDPRDGAVRAMSAHVPSGRPMLFNLASQGHRQAGSAFKVFTLTAALYRGIPLSSVWQGPSSLTIPDKRCLNANGPWVVRNFADESAGTMTLLSAIAHSVNTIFAQVSQRIGPRAVVQMAHRLGVTSPLTPVCSITLGPEGVTPLEMTRAFATLAARGVRRTPTALERVTGPDGRVLKRLRAGGRRVISAGLAARATYALSGVVLAGTGMAANPGRPAAGKTGTAEENKDAWFCGFVPQLATCVWMGHPQAEIPMHDVAGFEPVVGGSVPARIWHDFMVGALQGRPVRRLPTVQSSAVQSVLGSGTPPPTATTTGAVTPGVTTPATTTPGRH